MIPCIGVKLCEETYYPLYNINAMFRMQDEFPQDVLDKIQENTEASYELAFRFFRMLCEEGEAIRKKFGYEAGKLPDLNEAKYSYLPADITTLKNAIYSAVTLGCTREVETNEEIDLILLEQKKKTE